MTRLSSRVGVLVLLLLVPLALALASQALASRPGAPAVPEGPVVVDVDPAAAVPSPIPSRVATSPVGRPAPAVPPSGETTKVAPDAPRVVQPRRPAAPAPAPAPDDDDDEDDEVEVDD